MIARAKHKDELLHRKGTTSDIMRAVVDCYNRDWKQVVDFAESAPRGDTLSKCRWIFDFVDQNIEYVLDPFGKQWIRTPARLWADRQGDCKSFAIFICSVLRCLGIPHSFRFACYDGNKEPTHVYAVAYDEEGNEIIVDPVYRNKEGVALFNQESEYNNIIDMAGTTEISRLSGIGESAIPQIITIPGKKYLPRGEQDFLINLNNLDLLYQGAVKLNDLQWANHISNLMDVASVTILCFEKAEEWSLDIPHALACVRQLYLYGAFDSPVGTTLDQRESKCSSLFDQIVEGANLATPQDDDLSFLLNLTAESTPDFNPAEYLGGSASVGFLSEVCGMGATSKATAEQIAMAQSEISKYAEYYMYTFITDSKIDEYPAIVGEKRAYYLKQYQQFEDAGAMTRDDCLVCINNSLLAKYQKEGRAYLLAVKNGDIPPYVGGASFWLEILKVLLPGLLAVLPGLLSLWLGVDEETVSEEIEGAAPDIEADGFVSSSTNITTGTSTGTSTGTIDNLFASSNLPGLLLAGGVLMALLFGKSSDGKKKK